MTTREMQLVRISMGLSIRALAKKLGVSTTVIDRAEAGIPITLAHAKILADYYGCAVLDLPSMRGHIPDEEAAA